MTISAGTTLVVGCTLLLGGPSHAFVAPAAPARHHHPTPPPSRTARAATAATAVRPGEMRVATRGRRRRSRMPDRLPGSAGGSRPGLATPLLMSSSGDGGKISGEQGAEPAELADPPASASGGGNVGSETGDPATRAALKQKLLRKVATLNRGFLAQEADRLDVEEIVEMLEMENPNPKPCEAFGSGSSPLAGRWQLLYTTSLDVLSLQVNPTVTVGKIFQEIEADGRAIQNIIELQPPFAAVNKILGSSMATLTVKLETDPVSDSRINLKFVRTEIKADSLFGRKLDLPTLGVDLPSAEKLENILPKGRGEGGGGGDLKGKLEDAKNKAQALARKAKDKQKGLKTAAEEKIKGGAATGPAEEKEEAGGGGEAALGDPKDGLTGNVVDVEAVAVTEEKEEEEIKGEEGETEESSSSSSSSSGGGEGGKTESSSTSSAALLRKPYFESTYCDEDLRVGRTGSGDMFVSVRA